MSKMDVPTKSKSDEETEQNNAEIVINPLDGNSLPNEFNNEEHQESDEETEEADERQSTSDENQNLYPTYISEREFHLIYRITKSQFHEIHDLLKNDINMKNAAVPESITSEERLLIALEFLGTGEDLISLGSIHEIGFDAVKEILQDVFHAVWTKMGPVYMPKPTASLWQESENFFQIGMNFPNCCGVVYGKRVNLISPVNDVEDHASNDKKEKEIILLTIVNPRGKFLIVDVGSYNQDSDDGVFENSALGKLFEDGELDLPAPKQLSPNSQPAQHVIVADEAFPMKPYLLRPYSEDDARDNKPNIIFNTRISDARNSAEIAFAIAKARWPIFDGPLHILPEMAEKVLLGIFCLNNYLGLDDMPPDCSSRGCDPLAKSATFSDLKSINENASEDALAVRSKFTRLFCEEGPVPWLMNLLRMSQKG